MNYSPGGHLLSRTFMASFARVVFGTWSYLTSFVCSNNESFETTVEPLTNDHPHQRPSLSYDHISCDGQWFLFVYESLTSDHPSYTTTPMWFWGWLYKRGSTVLLLCPCMCMCSLSIIPILFLIFQQFLINSYFFYFKFALFSYFRTIMDFFPQIFNFLGTACSFCCESAFSPHYRHLCLLFVCCLNKSGESGTHKGYLEAI